MSNIPSNAMPHAGGTSTNTDDRRATQPTGTRSDDSSVSYGSGYTPGAQQSGSYSAETSTYSRQPDQYRENQYRTVDYRDRSSGSLMEKARDHKTGIALGVAVGAIAAAAIPFMFSGKKKSSENRDVDYSADVYVDNREAFGRQTQGRQTSERQTYASASGSDATTGSSTSFSGSGRSSESTGFQSDSGRTNGTQNR